MTSRLSFCLAAMAALGACSNASAPSTSPASSTQIAPIDLTRDDILALSGRAVSMDKTSSGAAIGPFGDAAMTITVDGGAVTRVQANGPSGSGLLDGSVAEPGERFFLFETDASAPKEGTGFAFLDLLSADGKSSAPLNYMIYGFWGLDGDSTDQILYDAAHIGLATPGRDVPATGTAVYLGTGRGVSDLGSGGIEVILSNIRAETEDFQSFAFAATGSRAGGDLRPQYDAAGTLTVSGNRLTGNITSAGGAGAVDARFYGTEAAEMGGVYYLEGTDLDRIGAFGAARDPEFVALPPI